MRQKIIEVIREQLDLYRDKHKLDTMWREPQVGFTDANHPEFSFLKEIVHPSHFLPSDFMDSPTVVLCYFLPFSSEVIESNRSGNFASKLLIEVSHHSETVSAVINDALIGEMQDYGYRAVKPNEINGIDDQSSIVYWSHEHIAWLGGMGTFGAHNRLITDYGCNGHYSSLITDLLVAPDTKLSEENCLLKRNGRCGMCFERCVGDALSLRGYSCDKCQDMLLRAKTYFRDEGIVLENKEVLCEKCAAGVPCSLRNPLGSAR